MSWLRKRFLNEAEALGVAGSVRYGDYAHGDPVEVLMCDFEGQPKGYEQFHCLAFVVGGDGQSYDLAVRIPQSAEQNSGGSLYAVIRGIPAKRIGPYNGTDEAEAKEGVSFDAVTNEQAALIKAESDATDSSPSVLMSCKPIKVGETEITAISPALLAEPMHMGDVRKSARAWAKRHGTKTVKNRRLGREVQVRESGLDSAIQHQAAKHKLMALAAIDEIALKGFPIYWGPNKKRPRERLVVLAHKVLLPSGEFYVSAGFRDAGHGPLFYDHEVMEVKATPPGFAQAGSARGGIPATKGGVALNDYTRQFLVSLVPSEGDNETSDSATLDSAIEKLIYVEVGGIPIRIEYPKGAWRSGVDVRGKPWRSQLAAAYGFIANTHNRGNDGESIDAFVGPFPDAQYPYVINQHAVGDGRFDEHKVMLGFVDEDAAKRAYLRSYADDFTGFGSIIRLTYPQLRWWLKHGPFARPLEIMHLPFARTVMNTRINWDGCEPDIGFAPALYSIRKDDVDDGLLLDACDMDALDCEFDCDFDAVDPKFGDAYDRECYAVANWYREAINNPSDKREAANRLYQKRLQTLKMLSPTVVAKIEAMAFKGGNRLIDYVVFDSATMDAIAVENKRIEVTAKGIMRKLRQHGGALKPMESETVGEDVITYPIISKPRMLAGVLNKTVLFKLNDGQTITIFFNNPDANPRKLKPTDLLVSWRWLLNRKDVTIVVAPERGQDLDVNIVAQRIMGLAEKNSAAFVKAQGGREAVAAEITILKQQIADTEKEWEAVEGQIKAIKEGGVAKAEPQAEGEKLTDDPNANKLTHEQGEAGMGQVLPPVADEGASAATPQRDAAFSDFLAEGRSAWEVSKAQWIAMRKADAEAMNQSVSQSDVSEWADYHRQEVQRGLDSDAQISAEVLADYPEMKKVTAEEKAAAYAQAEKSMKDVAAAFGQKANAANPQRESDIAYLTALRDGKADYWSPDIADKLEAINERVKGDADAEPLLEAAANAWIEFIGAASQAV